METKYVIYELVQSELLKTVEPDGYYSKTTYREVLEKISNINSRFNDEHKTMESAIEYINEIKKKLQYKRLTILPVIDIPYYYDDNE